MSEAKSSAEEFPCSNANGGCKSTAPKEYLALYRGGVCRNCDMSRYLNGVLPDYNDKTLCQCCFKKLVPIGNSRANGASHDDWDGRKYHKKCWMEMKDEEE